MYMHSDFLDMAMENLKQEWKSPEHKAVAETILLFNPNIFTMDRLMDGCKAINEIESPETFTTQDGIELGLW